MRAPGARREGAEQEETEVTNMEFELSEEQQQIKMSVREFANRRFAPHVLEWDRVATLSGRVATKAGRVGIDGRAFSG
jgi:alkylation response protein AidB-like acyl-CoA dehydrogenase